MRLGFNNLGIPISTKGGGLAATTGFDFRGGSLPAGLTFTRASTASFYDKNGIVQQAANDTARFDYNPSTLALNGLAIEEQRTNLLLQSQDTTAVAWVKTGSPTITNNNAGAPDGNATLNHFTRTTTGPSYANQGLIKTVSSLPYAFSFFAKMGSVGSTLAVRLQGTSPNRIDVAFNLSTGTAGTPAVSGTGFVSNGAAIQSLPNGIYRVFLMVSGTDAAAAIGAAFSFNSTGSNQIDTTDSVSNSDGYIWGFQLEQAAIATSYIPTTTVAATRAADNLAASSLSWFNALQGAYMASYIDMLSVAEAANRYIVGFSDGTANNRIENFIGVSSFTMNNRLVTGGTQTNPGNVALNGGALNKIGAVYNSGTNASFTAANGTLGTASSPASIPVITALNIGGSSEGSLAPLNGWLQMFNYWNYALTQAQLQQVTT